MAEQPAPDAEPGISVTRVFDAPASGLEGMDGTRAVRRLVRRHPVRGAARHGVDGRPARGRVAADDVRRARARVIHWKGEFREVVEPERLVFTVSDRPDEVYELVTVVLADLGDGRTEMRFEQRGHMSAEQYERAESGWGVFFDVIAKHLSNT